MAKSATMKGIVALLIVSLVTYAAWDNTQETQPVKERLLPSFQTSSTRTNNVQTYCPVSLDRTTLAPTADVTAAQSTRSSVESQLGIDGNALMNKLARMNMGEALSMITANMVNMAMFLGVFIVPFIVFLFIWPFLCCCCCCPSCCPSKCCQKSMDEPYTKCELYWPSFILALSLLLIISISVYGMMNSSTVGQSFKNMACSIAIFTDDLLNGNTTTNGTFFTGLNVFSSSLSSLNGNLTNIKNNLTDVSNLVSGTTYTAVNNIQTVQTSVKKIPDNAGTGTMALVYNTPINSAATTGTLPSTFVNILGTSSANGSLLSNLYVSIEYARLMMQGIKNNSNTFAGQVATIQTSISTMQTTLTSLTNDVTSMDSNLGTLLSLFNMPSSFGSIGVQAFYGFLIGFSCLALLGMLLTTCCDKPGCRHLMYFACIFLFLGGIVGFLISVLFSIMVPTFTWTCSFLSVAMTNSTGFSANFGALLSNSTVNQISVCMPFGDGNIVNTVAGSATNGLNNLTSVISSLNTFNNATLQSYIAANLSALISSANSYANGDISDLDTTNNNILVGFSYPTNSTNNALCTSFTDSWVPSNNQVTSYSTAIPCQSNAGTGLLSNCNANFGPAGTCQGCMDTTQLLTQQANAAAVTAAVKNKYGTNCAFATILSNSWTNYFSKKYTSLGYPTVKTQVSGTVMYRMQQAQAMINTTTAGSVFASIDSFRGVLNTVNSGLSSISTLTDPTYGMLAGLNCQLFGQDFVTFQNVICGSFYNNMYTIRLTFGIASWGILFSLCCIVCSGVRHFKNMNRRAMVAVSDQSFKNTFDEGASKRVLRQRSPRKNTKNARINQYQ